jgi:hypothetical protein
MEASEIRVTNYLLTSLQHAVGHQLPTHLFRATAHVPHGRQGHHRRQAGRRHQHEGDPAALYSAIKSTGNIHLKRAITSNEDIDKALSASPTSTTSTTTSTRRPCSRSSCSAWARRTPPPASTAAARAASRRSSGSLLCRQVHRQHSPQASHHVERRHRQGSER